MAFKQIETKALPDIQTEATIYEHVATGAKVLRLANDDVNKSFMIGFRTPPYSDNGITHIIEHSVLNGSEKYPSKEPFVDLIKGSLNTFVNAITFSDKTIYPVASTHDKDFQNLMSVYLDAVFKPKFIENDLILAQEGWHYHLENEEDPLIYKGVVYNEMKGAMASPEQQVYRLLQSALYPDTFYEHMSGGLPSAIPELTQEEFVDYHGKYYHPSNSLTVLYGNMDDEVTFAQLAEYFDGYERQDEAIDLTIDIVKPELRQIHKTYSITEGEAADNKTFLALAWHTEDAKDQLDVYGMDVLSEILFGYTEAPLKKALLDAEVGGDIDGYQARVGYVGMYNMVVKYSEPEKMARMKEVVNTTLRQLVEEGIPESHIQAAINKISFELKEAAISESNPRGVFYSSGALNTWLYNESPYLPFEFTYYLDQLQEQAQNGYFEDLIQRKFIDNEHYVELILEPEAGKNDRLEAETLEKLQAYKDSLTEEELQSLVKRTKTLIERQESKDSDEDLAKIPSLERSDLSSETEEWPLLVEPFEDFDTFYFAEQFTAGIDYVNFYFDISDISGEEYELLGFISKMLTNVSTEHYSLADLTVAIDSNTGGISTDVTVFENEDGIVRPYFALTGKAIHEQLPKLIELMSEIVQFSRFDKSNEILNNTVAYISIFEQYVDYQANAIATARAMSQLFAGAKLSEQAKGIDAYRFLKDVRNRYQAGEVGDFVEQLANLLQRVINKQRLSVLYIGEASHVESLKEMISQAFKNVSSEPLDTPVQYTPGKRQNEAFVAAQDVNYVILGANTRGHMEYDGASLVMANIANFDYLWNLIRVQGGAYGAGFRHIRVGHLAFTSYRDPNISRSLDIYREFPEYLSQIEFNDEALTKKIIGTFSGLIRPKSAYHKGLTAFSMHQGGRTYDDLVQLKEEVINTTVDQIRGFSQPLKDTLEDQSTVVVIGNKVQIENQSELFDVISHL